MSIRVAIADDHTLVAEGISKMLSRHSDNITITAHYSTGAALLEGLKDEQPDVLLLDIQFPDASGHDLAGHISSLYPTVSILAISSIDDPFDVQHMLQHGCLGYVHKTVSTPLLVEAIETVCKGQRFLEASIRERLWETELDPDAPPLYLSEKELEILELICGGLSNIDIGERLFMSHRTIEKYKLSFYKKFGVQNAVGLAKMATKHRLLK